MASSADKAKRAILFGGSRAHVPLSCRIAFSWNRSRKGLCVLRRLRLSVPAPTLAPRGDPPNLRLTTVGALRRGALPHVCPTDDLGMARPSIRGVRVPTASCCGSAAR